MKGVLWMVQLLVVLESVKVTVAGESGDLGRNKTVTPQGKPFLEKNRHFPLGRGMTVVSGLSGKG